MRLRKSHVIRFLERKSGVWERLTIDECAEEVVNLLDDPSFQETPESQRIFRNLALGAHVRSALRQDPRTSKMTISIAAKDGVVTLAGLIDVTQEAKDATDIATKVDGVKELESRLRVAGPARTLHMEG